MSSQLPVDPHKHLKLQGQGLETSESKLFCRGHSHISMTGQRPVQERPQGEAWGFETSQAKFFYGSHQNYRSIHHRKDLKLQGLGLETSESKFKKQLFFCRGHSHISMTG